MIEIGIARTLAVLREMAEGKTIKIGEYDFGMTPEMRIGPITYYVMGSPMLGKASEMSLSSFHSMLERENVGAPIFK